jgi:hypothetical protein
MNPVRIVTPLDYDSSNFKENQTVCMSYNANTKIPSPWTTNNCLTNYTDMGIICSCTKLNNHYYGLVNDYTRDAINEERFDTQFTWPFLIILMLMIPGLTLPCIALYLDRSD